ncbi:hypothetical protein M9H77_23067 [Catharanthus roseus]|uniref:Uncharacterized protein n=1 Tax=Catharanthus roseus TaxID=4058 RepID=A0ACC0AS90_CATRO|nr:hypothetical protein M9H77_23067 [Catharanthus roseus]
MDLDDGVIELKTTSSPHDSKDLHSVVARIFRGKIYSIHVIPTVLGNAWKAGARISFKSMDAEMDKYKFNHRFMRIKAKVSLALPLRTGIFINRDDGGFSWSLSGMNRWQRYATTVVDWGIRNKLATGARKFYLDPEIHGKLLFLGCMWDTFMELLMHWSHRLWYHRLTMGLG